MSWDDEEGIGEIPIATDSTLGGIMVGSGLVIDPLTGKLSSIGADFDHNLLSGLQGGQDSPEEYYHLTSSEKTVIENTSGVNTGDQDLSGWNAITDFTATPASTSTITMTSDLTGTILVGYPLKYTIGGTTYYGIVSAITANLLTVNGAPLGGDVTALYYGSPDKVSNLQITIPSTYEDASNTDLIQSDLKSNFIWDRAKSYLVRFGVYSDTVDGGADGQASVQINNTEVNTTAGGATLAVAKTWYNTVVNIATDAYDINPGEELEITCIKGTGGDASDLTVKLIFVLP